MGAACSLKHIECSVLSSHLHQLTPDVCCRDRLVDQCCDGLFQNVAHVIWHLQSRGDVWCNLQVSYTDDRGGYGSELDDEEAERREKAAKQELVPAFMESQEGYDDEVERVLGHRY